jgi:hypothetical protein
VGSCKGKRRCQLKKADDRRIFAVRLKGGRLKQVLANALFGRCFPANKHLSGVLDGGGLVFSLAGCGKAHGAS